MAMQGVTNALFELISSNDKNASTFLSSLKTGDSLKGRITEVLTGQDKAVINFRGYNMICQIPENAQLTRGETLTFTVTNTNDKIFMKIVNDPAIIMARGMEAQPGGVKAVSSQFAEILTALKIPLNEQNIFIASRLTDYHISVTKENMLQMTTALNNFMDSKGIDMRAFGADSMPAVKETIVLNSLRLMSEASPDKAQPPMVQINTQSRPSLAAADYASLGKISTAPAAEAPQNAASVERMSNMLSVINSLAKSVSDGSMRGDASSFSISFSTSEAPYLSTALRNGAVAGFISNSQVQQAADAVSGKGSLTILSGSAWAEILPGKNEVTITFNNIPGAVAEAAKNSTMQPQLRHEINTIINKASDGSIIEVPSARADAQLSSMPGRDAAIRELASLVNSLKTEITAPQNTTPQQNAAAIMNGVNIIKQNIADNKAMKSEAAASKGSPDAGISTGTQGSVPVLTSKLEGILNKFLAEAAGIAKQEGQSQVNPVKFQPQAMAQFREAAQDMASALKSLNFQVQKESVFTPPAINTPFDPDTSIEALALLKSRQIEINNPVFVETMSRYFKSDMKLASNIEALSSAINAFQSHPATAAESKSVQGIKAAAADLKNVIEQMLIRPDASAKHVDVASQLKAFTDKSGLNIENRLSAAPHEISAAAAGSFKDNLKTGLVRLTDEINRIDAYKLSQSFRESVVKMRDAASDTLANLTALQMMNHKPAALEMMYTQLPLFADNKLFNGELQVWYRKGAPKENPSAAVPVNLVFVLNTSNLGAIKVNMTVFKNEVECTVKTGNEKAKQALTRMRNDFLENLKGGNYSVKAFSVTVDNGQENGAEEPSSGGYVELGRINLQA